MGRAARAVLVLHRAAAAVPVLPPDPLQMLDLERHEGEDPEEDHSPGHSLKVAQERAARHGPPPQGATGRAAPKGPARLILRALQAYQRRAPAPPKPPVNRLISQMI